MTAELHNDFGHGKNTYPPNKGVPGLPEFEFNSAVGREIKRLLEGTVPTFEAQPFNGYDIPLITRTNKYNARWHQNKDAIGISSHANANGNPDVRGFGVFYWHSSPEAKKLAQILLDEYKKEFPDREKYPIWGDGLFASKPGTWTDFHMNRETEGVFVLVEWEFMTNPEALKLLKSDDYRKRCALVAANAVWRWYGIKKPSKVVAASEKAGWKKENGKWYYYKVGKKQVGWIKDRGQWYFLDPNGVIVYGWLDWSGKRYYLKPEKESGAMVTGTQMIAGKLYYFNKDGSLVKNDTVNMTLKADKDGILKP